MVTYVGSFPSVYRSFERHGSRTKGNIFKDASKRTTTQVSTVTTPDLPPKVFQPAGGGILQFFVCGGVNCWDEVLVTGYQVYCAVDGRT